MKSKLLEKPYKLLSITGTAFAAALIVLNLISGYFTEGSVFPYAKAAVIAAEAASLVLFILSFIFSSSHVFYYSALELLVLHCLYAGKSYTALFLSSLLLALLMTDKILNRRLYLIIYTAQEILKAALVLPSGTTEFLYYAALDIFSICTICCINLLFHHVYDSRNTSRLDLESLKLTDRQKDCIKEIVLNNTTIKELAINHKVSESAIKKDLGTIYSTLGITGKADLKALFIDYRF